MIRSSLLVICFLFCFKARSQNVGINGTGSAPDASSMLDVSATNKGILIPRVSLSGLNDATTISSPATSLLVFNTATAGLSPNNVSPGFYYWNGVQWSRLTEISSLPNFWTQVNDSLYPSIITKNVGIGTRAAISPLTVFTSRDENTLRITNSTSLTSESSGIYNTLSSTSTGAKYGIYSLFFGNGSGEQFGISQRLNNSGSGNQTGILNIFSGYSARHKFGLHNIFTDSSFSLIAGTYNEITGASQNQYGTLNQIFNPYGGVHAGNWNLLFNVGGSALQYGTHNHLRGDGDQIGTNTVITEGDGNHIGSSVTLSSDGSGTHTGLQNTFSGNGTGQIYGIRTDIDATGDNQIAGSLTNISSQATGTGLKYGHFVFISNASGGTGYGIYSSVLKAGSFAGFFRGNVQIEAGNLRMAGNIIPTTNNIRSLGTPALRWSRVWCTAGVFNASDLRLKKNITNISYGLKEVMQLRAVNYEWKEFDSQKDIGFIAQEIRELLPEAVIESKDSMNTLLMNYNAVIPVLVKAIQEQQAVIESLKKENTELKSIEAKRESEVKIIEDRILSLEASLGKMTKLLESMMPVVTD